MSVCQFKSSTPTTPRRSRAPRRLGVVRLARRSPTRPLTMIVIALMGPAMLTQCQAEPRSSRLQIDDFNVVTEKMIQSLASSEFLADRDADSPPAYVTINNVENLTHDVISQAEQWMLIAKLRAAMPLQHLRQNKNVTFQIAPEQHTMLRQAGFEGDLGSAPKTTHVLKAVFMSSPRFVTDEDQQDQVTRRQDFYYLEYFLVNVQTRETVWNDTFEFKREAVGLAID